MKNNKEKSKDLIYFDTSKTYICPMIRKGTIYPNEIEDEVEVRLQPAAGGYDIHAIKSGYDKKYFYDNYLQWLFYTGYIKEF